MKRRVTCGKTLSIHSRNSVADILSVIEDGFNCKVIIHWFSGNIDELKNALIKDFIFQLIVEC